MMNRLPPSWIAIVAVAAAVAVLVVLITPALDELPSTSPHVLAKVFLAPAGGIYLPPNGISPRHGIEVVVTAAWAGADLLSYTCTRLC
jgi:hypothetical protein